MAGRSTRNKIRFQGKSAIEDLQLAREFMGKAQDHLAGIAGLADDQSEYIDKHLPGIMASLDMLIGILDMFKEGL